MISIIILTHNKEKKLERLLSIIYQQVKKEEIIIVNDAGNKINYLLKKYPKIKIINNEKNYGPARSRNEGINKSKYDYVHILSNDYLVQKNHVKKLYPYLKNEITVFTIKNKKNNYFQNAICNLRDLNNDGTQKVSGGALIHKKVFEKIGLFNENFRTGEDVELAQKAKKKGLVIKKSEHIIYVEEDSFVKNIKKYYLYGQGKAKLNKLQKNKENTIKLLLGGFKDSFRNPKYLPIHLILIMSERLGIVLN